MRVKYDNSRRKHYRLNTKFKASEIKHDERFRIAFIANGKRLIRVYVSSRE